MNRDESIKKLKRILDPYDQVDSKIFEKAIAYFELKDFQNREYLKQAGDTDRYLRYILEGVAVLCHISEKGVSTTKYVFLPGSIAYDPESWSSNFPSNYTIEARSEVETIMLRKSFEKELIRKFPEFLPILMKMIMKFQSSFMQFQMEFSSLNSFQKYDKLLGFFPHLGNILMSKDISGVLGISRSTLCAIKRSKENDNS